MRGEVGAANTRYVLRRLAACVRRGKGERRTTFPQTQLPQDSDGLPRRMRLCTESIDVFARHVTPVPKAEESSQKRSAACNKSFFYANASFCEATVTHGLIEVPLHHNPHARARLQSPFRTGRPPCRSCIRCVSPEAQAGAKVMTRFQLVPCDFFPALELRSV